MFRSTTFFLCLPHPHFLPPLRRAILRASLRTLRSVRKRGGEGTARNGNRLVPSLSTGAKVPPTANGRTPVSGPLALRRKKRDWRKAGEGKRRRRRRRRKKESEEGRSPPSSYAIRCTYSALSLLLRSASLSLFLCLRPPRGASMCEVSLCGGGGGGGGRENERDGGEKGGTGMRTGIRQDVSFPSSLSLSVCLLPVFISRNGSSVCRERERDRGEKPPHVPPPVYVRTSCQGLFACGRQ